MEHVNEAFAPAAGFKGPGLCGPPLIESGDEMEVDPVVTLKIGGQNRADENGDHNRQDRDGFMHPQAEVDDIDNFLIQAGNAEQFDEDASIEKALGKLGLQSTRELLPSLKIQLMPHQLLGVAWMVEKEKTKSLKGGCMADEMGLGKMVQMIATMCKNPSEEPACKTTLILAPLALLDQWKQEIATKTNADWKVLIYHGSNKVKRKADLLEYDVVLTTYSTMALEWPDYDAAMKKKEKIKKNRANEFISDLHNSGPDHPNKKHKKERGLLFQVDFYRIVLDEAQNIRNKRVSRAVTELSADLRWCLTATPIINSLIDVYGYLRFLKVRPWYDWTEFNSHVGRLEKKHPQLAVTRLQVIFGLFLLRRMKTTMLDGKRLVELPERNIELVSLVFSKEERDIYSMVETRQQEMFNRYLKAGTVLKNYASVLEMLLRLRQLCSHPALIQENGSHFLAADEVDEPGEYRDEITRARAVMPPEFFKKMKAKFKEAALRRIEAEKESADAVVDQDDCLICFDTLTLAVVTPCAHQFCRDCITDILQTPLPDEADARHKHNERPCPSCRSAISSETLFPSAAFESSQKDLAGDPHADDDEDIEMKDVKPAKPVSKSKGKGEAERPPGKSTARRFVVLDSSDAEDEGQPASEDDDASDLSVESDGEEKKDARRDLKKRLGRTRAITTIVESDDSDDDHEMNCDSREGKEILSGAKNKRLSKEAIKLMPKSLPSTKMKKMMDVLKKLFEDTPDEKTLVVSQWTGCLTIVSDYLTEAGIVHVKYQGDMNSNKRDQAVQVFMSKDKARVMLMSLKCGGVGLNLTRASNVISLDPGWSPAIDAQAFDRVHRLGQTRNVIVKRLVIADTVEDRILALQERKQNLANGSLGEGNGMKIGKLSVREIATLFGLDARGRVLVQN